MDRRNARILASVLAVLDVVVILAVFWLFFGSDPVMLAVGVLVGAVAGVSTYVIFQQAVVDRPDLDAGPPE